jgi:putative cell wall-binding protein
MRVRRSVCGLVVAASAVVMGAAPVNAAATTFVRIAGEGRYETAAQVSARSFEPHPAFAYVTTGDNFPDALSAGPAAAKSKSPVILVRQDAIPQSVQTELHRVHPDNIILVGGSDAVSDRVADKLLDLNYTNGTVTRVAGVDRYDTAAKLSAATFAAGVPIAFVATGLDFADALSGGAAAGAGGGPMLLVRPDAIPSTTAAELDRLNPAAIVVLGGTNAVSSAVQTALGAYSSTVVRRAGVDRYGTSAAVSAAAFNATAFPSGIPTPYVATGQDFPDALAGTAPAAITPAPMLLVRQSCMPSEISAEIDRLKATTLVVLGGTAAVSDAAAARAGCSGGSLPTTG